MPDLDLEPYVETKNFSNSAKNKYDMRKIPRKAKEKHLKKRGVQKRKII